MEGTAPPKETSFRLPMPAASAASDTVTKAVAYVLTMQEENGAWSRLKGEFPAESEPTSWAVKALSALGREADGVRRGLSFILKDQRQDGSWRGNNAHTAFAILALAEARTGADAIQRSADYLRGVQDEEGGFARIGKEGQPLTAYTANVLYALRAAGLGKDSPLVGKALSWLTSCQNRDGGYGMTKGADSTALATTWTIRALRAFGVDQAAAEVQNAFAWLLTMQGPTGGFSMTSNAPEDPEVTSLAIIALAALSGQEEAVVRAAACLSIVQHPDGAFTSSMPMQFNNVAKKNTQTTLFVIWALAEVL